MRVSHTTRPNFDWVFSLFIQLHSSSASWSVCKRRWSVEPRTRLKMWCRFVMSLGVSYRRTRFPSLTLWDELQWTPIHSSVRLSEKPLHQVGGWSKSDECGFLFSQRGWKIHVTCETKHQRSFPEINQLVFVPNQTAVSRHVCTRRWRTMTVFNDLWWEHVVFPHYYTLFS